MKRNASLFRAVSATLLGMTGLAPVAARAVDTVSFSAYSAGSTHAISQWGVEIVDLSPTNLRESLDTMGPSLTLLTTSYDLSHALSSDGSLSTGQQQSIDSQIAVANTAGTKLLIEMGPNVGDTDSSYSNGSSANVAEWAQAMVASKEFWQANGYTVAWAAPFTEPDYWTGQGTAAQNAQIMEALQANSAWTGTQLLGASTLNSDNAQSWYNPLVGVANAGSTHLLGGSLSSYVSFIQSVENSGGQFAAPEMHSLGEAIVTANYNAVQGAWWGPAYPARGTFSQASSGRQLGYSVNYSSQTAAAVYRGTDGSTYAFASGLERFGGPDTYNFTTDRAAYFNGIGPILSYSMQADSDADTAVTSNQFLSFGQSFDQGAMAKVDYGSATIPALDGYRWQIQNVQSGQVLTVAGGSTSDGATVNTSGNSSGLNQMWNIVATEDGYIELFNANSGLTLDDNGGSTTSGTQIWQYGTAINDNEQWYLAPAGNGTFYIKNANSTLYLTGSSSSTTQNNLSSGSAATLQQWRFVSANPTRAVKANYAFAGNANDSTGTYNGTITGTAAYTTGPTTGSQALVFNAANTYVTLPANVANSSSGTAANTFSGITVDAWVKWNGGNAWQRVFDFGTGTSAYMFLTPDSSAGTMRFGITSAGTTEEEDVDTAALQTGQWVNLAVTLGGHSAIIYENGRPVSAGSVLVNPTYFNPTLNYIGKSQFSDDPLFNGSISQFAVYDYALSQSQIDDLINNNLTWVGGQNVNAWDAGSTSNFKLASNGSSAAFTQGDRVTFDGTGTSAVVITGAVSPFAVTVTGSSNITFTGSGSISGSQTPLTMSGTGTLTIANTGGNSFTGDTTINSGTISIAADNALGTDAANLTLNGGMLQTTSTNAMVFGHSTMVTPAGGNLQIIGNGTSTTNQADRLIFASGNMLIGSGTLTITGNGTLAGTAPNTTTAGAGALVLNGTNAFAGTINLQNGGLLEFAANGALDPSAIINVGNQAEFVASNGATVANAVTITGGTNSVLSFTNTAGTFSGPIALNANLTVGLRNWYDYATVQSGTISGVISGTGGLTVNSGNASGGTLTLSGFNTFTGNVAVSNAVVDAANGTNVVSPTSSVLGNPATAARTVAINSGGTVAFTVGNVLGSGGQSTAPGLSFIVNQGGVLETAAGNAGGAGGGDANIFGNITLNGGTFTTGNGYNAAYQSAILLGSVSVGGTALSTMSTNATNTTANGIMLGTSGGVTFIVAKTCVSGADLSVSAPLVDSNAGNSGSLIKTGLGTIQLTGSDTFTGGTTVNAGTLVLASAVAFPSGTSLTTAPGAMVQIANHGAGATFVPIVGKLSNTGTIDITNNAMVLLNASAGAVFPQIQAGYNNGNWNGSGSGVITSSLAAADSRHLMAVGMATGLTSFEGQSVSSTSILLKYTYYGDANLDGTVDGSDYSRIDNGYLNKLTGWFNGDFNYDNVVNGSDYTLIDNAFNTQGAELTAQTADGNAAIAAQIAPASAVPEPATLAPLLLGLTTLGRRRQSRKAPRTK